MLLGASGSKAGLTVDLEVATDPTKTGDAGVPHGNELLAFATAANRRGSWTRRSCRSCGHGCHL